VPLVTANKGATSTEVFDQVLARLPQIVAEELSCPEGVLTPKDIEVQVRFENSRDIHNHRLGIIIEANDYPNRRVNLDERRRKIVERVGVLAGDEQGYVWVRLSPGSYGEF